MTMHELSRWGDTRETDLPVVHGIYCRTLETGRTMQETWEEPWDSDVEVIAAGLPDPCLYHWGQRRIDRTGWIDR